MYVFVSEDHMLDWHSCQICYPLDIKLLLFLSLLLSEDHAEHIFVGAEDNYGCICQFPLIRSIHPKTGSLCQLWHLNHRKWWACNLDVAEITIQIIVELSFNFIWLVIVIAYALMMVACWLPDKGSFSVIRRSVPFGRPGSLPTRPVLMANPTPASCISSLLRSLQKNV